MENKTETEFQPQHPSPKKPTDVDAFLKLLPHLVESFATKHGDPKTVSDLAIGLAREETAHMVMVGCAVPTLMCRDGRPLALLPGSAMPGTAQNPIGGGNRQGQMVAHFDNQNVQRIQGL